MKLTITISKTSDGKSQFVQIMSPEGMPINIVLVVDEIELIDAR